LKEELEFGLSSHIQFDIYFTTEHTRAEANSSIYSMSYQASYGGRRLIGCNSGNPTLYLEYILNKVVLMALNPSFYWVMNLHHDGIGINGVYETELAGNRIKMKKPS